MQATSGIKTVRRLLGIPVGGAEFRRDQVVELYKHSSMQSQSGGKHVIYYDIYARDRSGKKHKIAEGFKGESQANAAIRLIAREFGIRLPEERPAQMDEEDPLGSGVLT